jgi:hypothetical protein
MVVQNETSLTGDETKKILIRSATKSFDSKYIFAAVVFVFAIAILIFGLTRKETPLLIFSAIFAFIAVGYIFLIFLGKKKGPKEVIKNNEDICTNGVTYQYKFHENSLKVEVSTFGGKAKRIEYSYEEIKTITEYDDGYELQFENVMLYVAKDGFENDRMIDFFFKNIKLHKKKLKIKNRCNKKLEMEKEEEK